jgi:CheY-like chemotaxis protein
MKIKKQVPILIADDDLDDCQLIKEALSESRLANSIYFVHDGEELMDYLGHKGKYEDHDKYPSPGLILLDLNMPKKDGREALKEIKGNPNWRGIPVVVLTTSEAEEDIYRTYNLGVNSFITKPIAFQSLVQLMKDLGRYWFEIVELPESVEQRAK